MVVEFIWWWLYLAKICKEWKELIRKRVVECVLPIWSGASVLESRWKSCMLEWLIREVGKQKMWQYVSCVTYSIGQWSHFVSVQNTKMEKDMKILIFQQPINHFWHWWRLEVMKARTQNCILKGAEKFLTSKAHRLSVSDCGREYSETSGCVKVSFFLYYLIRNVWHLFFKRNKN